MGEGNHSIINNKIMKGHFIPEEMKCGWERVILEVSRISSRISLFP